MAAASPQPSSRSALRAASGAAALPALLAASATGLGAGGAFWWTIGAGWIAVSALLGGFVLRRGPLRLWWLGQAAAGVVLALAVGAFHAAAAGSGPSVPDVHRTLALDVDAGVALDPELSCEPGVRAGAALASPGAHPRLGSKGERLWFDAPGPEGRRQIHLLEGPDRDAPRARCWTCGEPGENRRPAPNPYGEGVLFESDRNGSVDVFVAETRERRRGRLPSRRVTQLASADRFPIFEAGGRGLVWSTGDAGRFAVEAAGMATGHGGLVLGARRRLIAGGRAWVAPLAWSPDARSLVYARGAGPGAFEGRLLDPATGDERSLGPLVAASFSRDGRLLAVASEEGRGTGPAGLGFLLARLPGEGGVGEGQPGRSVLLIGSPDAALAAVDLGPVADWGAPTGVALAPDGRSLVLGQWRRSANGGREERLIRLLRSCSVRP